METITGFIERISFQNDCNGFTIALLQCKERKDPVSIVGSLPTIQPGEVISCQGNWKKHPVYGWQFEVDSYRSERPADIEGIKKYLGSGLVKGIGKTYAERIVDTFGVDTLHVLDTTPHRLLDVPGLGKKRQSQIVSCWAEQRSVRDVMIFLQGHGVTSGYAQKIFRTYGDKSIERLRANPYCMARDIAGIGFKTADQIAQRLGMSHDAPERIDAGIEFVLQEMASEGHMCYPLTQFSSIASGLLQVDEAALETRVRVLIQNERLTQFSLVYECDLCPHIWLTGFFVAETGIAKEIKRLMRAPCQLRSIDTEKAIAWVQQQLNLTLAVNQHQAVCQAMQDKVQVITGGPGTGKSTITRAILTITQQLTNKIALTAPTGRAAKRLSTITGMPAKTIHGLLEWDFRALSFKHNRQNPLDIDLLIIDEASMIDTLLMYHLLKAIPDHARVIFVGDVNQLPSVGPGNVLKDMIASKTIGVTCLTEIFRQAAGSRIITNAHYINAGKMPELHNTPDSDFFFIYSETPEDVLRNVVTLVSERLPRKYRFNPLHDIQVMAPMKKGMIGIDNLNQALQQALNPNKTPLMRMGRCYQEGDKVMQIRNDYKKEVFNGDIGIISSISEAKQQMTVQFEERLVIYEFSELDALVLAYAVSVHKYQGSECLCIIMVVHTSHFKMLQRNLLYTGVTRGRQLVILVGSTKAVSLAVHNDEVKRRFTGLRQALEGTCISMPI
jgi:exodeoxyribonuclease V alpha subunit